MIYYLRGSEMIFSYWRKRRMKGGESGSLVCNVTCSGYVTWVFKWRRANMIYKLQGDDGRRVIM